ncbi:MAG: hypothetical protein KKB34_05135 [Bacteroidetes bacterium]|nr:hypothetical protein [Bacteroidota bacterium]
MALRVWKDHLGNKIQDHTGTDTVFKKTAAQLNISFTINPTVKVTKPMGSVTLNSGFIFTPTLKTLIFMKARLISQWIFNTSAKSKINKWSSIMFKFIGDR